MLNLNHNIPRIALGVLIIVLGAFIAWTILGGCGNRHVNKTIDTVKTESHVDNKKDTTSVKRVDSVGKKKEDFNYYKETVTETYVEPTAKAIGTQVSETKSELLGKVKDINTTAITNGSVVYLSGTNERGLIAKTTTKEWGKYTAEQNTDLHKADSNTKKEVVKEDTKKNELHKDIDITRTGLSFWSIFWICVGCVALGWFSNKIFPLIKKIFV